MNEKKTPPLKLWISGSREAYYQQVRIERQTSAIARADAQRAEARAK